jgi:hypothetical protein
MPTLRLRKRLLDRLVQGANSAGELGLALLMTAGVAHCGGSTQTGGEGTGDGAADHGVGIEAASESGVGIEAAGGDGSPSPIIEAPAPPPDSGSDAHGPVVEAAVFPDAGADGHVSPMVEAPAPTAEAGSDAHVSPWVEAPNVAPS